jgi:hypothetical protein
MFSMNTECRTDQQLIGMIRTIIVAMLSACTLTVLVLFTTLV